MPDTDTIEIAVRPLVEYAFRGGSLDDEFRTEAALTEGTKAHQAVQRQYGQQDQKEVCLSMEIPHGDLLFAVSGRCDGLLFGESGSATIDEIKSTAGDIGRIAEETYPVHWAQAQCYAFMYAKANGADRMRIRLTYVQIDTGEQRMFEREATFAELEKLVLDVIAAYAPFARMMRSHEREVIRSIGELGFPYAAYRDGQRKLAGAVYRSIEAGRNLFARAPTGIGKTISTLFPAVKAIGQGVLRQLFYLTARTTTRAAAEEALSRMRDRGLRLHAVTITAKEKICFQEQALCSKDHCEFADGYFDRINGAILDMISQETLMTREVIERYARKHRVCPFEMSLDAAYASEAVICDYNYVFDPRVSLKRLTGERKAGTVLLVDEAHNLVDRAREMFSAILDKKVFLEVQRAFKGVSAEMHEAAKAVNGQFIALRKRVGEGGPLILRELPEQLMRAVEAFAASAEKELAAGTLRPEDSQLLDVYFTASHWLRIGKLYDERFVTYAEKERNDLRIKQFCLDPSFLLRQMRKGYRSQICFSATLSPLNYYMDMLGAEPEDSTIALSSPFAREQWDVSVLPVSTRYRDRGRSKAAIAKRFAELVVSRPGNYLFFFPSYEYMNEVYEAFVMEESGAVKKLLQTAKMTEEERDGFLAAFDADNKAGLAGFAVLGGVFSEGVDLVGDRLQGVVVVGVGMPQVGLERDLIKQYCEGTGRRGFDYAYLYPGMNKVLQAGGRLIRSEHDRGVLMLVDDRYLQPAYRRLLPEEWRSARIIR